MAPTSETEETRAVIDVDADLIVVGGGLAGLCLALSAARHGAQVALVHDRPMLGGNSSSEVRVVPAGASHHSAWARETGIVEELLLEDRARNHAQFFENGLTNSMYDLVLLEKARAQEGLRLYLNTTVRAVTARDIGAGRRIDAVHGSQLDTEREFRFRAAQFADCTGDGTVGALAGAEWRYGREARHEFDEPLAPVTPDDVTSGATISLRARSVGRPVPFRPPAWIEEYRDPSELGLHRRLRSIEWPEFGGFWWLEVGYPFDQVGETEAVRDELLRHVLGVWNLLKNHHPDKDRFADYALEWFGMLPGKRESRRLLGDVVLNEAHCHTDQRWPDRIATAGWYIDLHVKGGILNKAEPGEPSFLDKNYRSWTRVAPYTVPLRMCYSRNVDNLWLGGRCVSATHVALGSLRVQQTLGMLGQAVGVAAAYAVAHGLTPRQVADPGGEHIGIVQRRVAADDVRILGVADLDDDDLARGATCRATSEAALDLAGPDRSRRYDLRTPRGQILPLTGPRLDRIEVFLVNDGSGPATVRARLDRLDTCWDRYDGAALGEAEIQVAGGFAGWCELPVSCSVPAPGPYRLALWSGDEVGWAASVLQPTGTVAQTLHVSAGGCLPENADREVFSPDEMALPAHRHWMQERSTSLALRTVPEQSPYGAANVTNGVAYPDRLPNLWVSDPRRPLPQSLEIDLGAVTWFDTVQVRFDTGLGWVLGRAPALWSPPECVRDYQVHVFDGEVWRQVAARDGNHRRTDVLTFPPVRGSRIRLDILAINQPAPSETELALWGADGARHRREIGNPCARIYSVKVFSRHGTTGKKGLPR
ncbi:FAD-dependent oxidoreductase [Actinoallomurus iriomotensis]|uniref:FAD dependent oxidoreductase n=1 Tax=Actinoallomurus iriomotensis TaxID=478107 RepID=A0A9W6W6S1_9ACTN|nr:FAD-dependent oxidoreductase [Actinoallomurus iriomotensis]GLY92302.1 hypothetical protein Airi02_102300 [Actinoallomurus iriomotensis]